MIIYKVREYYQEQLRRDINKVMVKKILGHTYIYKPKHEPLFGMQTKEVNEDIVYINTIK